MSMNKSGPVAPPMRQPTTKQMAQALVKMLAGREQITQALSILPNAVNRRQVEESLKEGISNLVNDIKNREGV